MTNPAILVRDAVPALLALGRVIIEIALVNVWNRLNVTTRQLAGSHPS